MMTAENDVMISRITSLQKQHGYSQAELARRIQMDVTAFSKFKNGTRGLSAEELNRIANVFDVPTDYLLGKQARPENIRPFNNDDVVEIPVVGMIKCGSDGLAMFDYQGNEFVSKEDINEDDDYFWLITTGDSMIGDYIQDGDYALIKRGNAFENGDICAVIVDGEEGTLKHVTKNKDSIVLSASNPSYPPRVFVGDDMNDIYIAGTLVEIKHKFK